MRTESPVYGNPNPAPLLVQYYFFLWSFAFSRLRDCFCARIVSYPAFYPWFSLPVRPISIFTLFLLSCSAVYYFMRALPHKHRVCAVPFP